MDPLNAAFKDYQFQHATLLPVPIRQGFSYLQTQVHSLVTVIDQIFLVPELMLRISQMSLAFFSFIPLMAPTLERPKKFCKDAKNFSNFLKGLKAIDGWLNFRFAWKLIVLNVSGMTLFIVSTLSLLERFQILNLSMIKTYLSAVPVFGILPYAGLLSFSMIGLMSMVALLNGEKRANLENEKIKIIDQKFNFWAQPLDLMRVQQLKAKHQAKFLNLRHQEQAYENLIQEGEKTKQELKLGHHPSSLYACQKALNELETLFKKSQADRVRYEAKSLAWDALERQWSHQDLGELEDFRQAKQNKWQTKINRIEKEKNMALITIINNVIIIARQALVLIAIAMGYGSIVLPLFANIGLDATLAGCKMTTFFMKRSIKKVNVPSINLIDYVHFNSQIEEKNDL